MKDVVFQGTLGGDFNILIRYPTEADVNSMHKFINDLSAERTFVRTQGVNITLDQEKRYLDSQLKKIGDRRSTQLLVFNNSQLIGISGVEMKDRAQKHIGNFGISVSSGFRDKGIGSKLTEIVLDEAENNLTNLKTIVLTVFANNPVAIDLYKKFGFKEFGRLPKGVTHRDKFVDEIYMYKEV